MNNDLDELETLEDHLAELEAAQEEMEARHAELKKRLNLTVEAQIKELQTMRDRLLNSVPLKRKRAEVDESPSRVESEASDDEGTHASSPDDEGTPESETSAWHDGRVMVRALLDAFLNADKGLLVARSSVPSIQSKIMTAVRKKFPVETTLEYVRRRPGYYATKKGCEMFLDEASQHSIYSNAVSMFLSSEKWLNAADKFAQ